jgi:hypothetical protein
MLTRLARDVVADHPESAPTGPQAPSAA